MSALRQGRVYFLLGNYEYAASLWQERAIPQLRLQRGYSALSAGQLLFKGEAKSAISTLLEIPGKLSMQASWEFDLALCRLESGLPDLAAERFTKALTLSPNLSVRPIITYYLEKLGKPVPPIPKEDQARPEQVEKPTTEPAKDEKPKEEKAEVKEPKGGTH